MPCEDLGVRPRARPEGFATLEEAKTFVEDFQPWDIFVGSAQVEFDRTVYPMPVDNG